MHMQLLYPYMKNRQIAICPSDDAPVACCSPNFLRTYQPSREMYYLPGAGGGGPNLSKFDDPAGSVLWGESKVYLAIYSAQLDAYMKSTIHNGGSNIAFADGHAKWIKRENLIQLKWDGATNGVAL
jgi:prepilin-type processing-associated H-X9-DG protein